MELWDIIMKIYLKGYSIVFLLFAHLIAFSKYIQQKHAQILLIYYKTLIIAFLGIQKTQVQFLPIQI